MVSESWREKALYAGDEWEGVARNFIGETMSIVSRVKGFRDRVEKRMRRLELRLLQKAGRASIGVRYASDQPGLSPMGTRFRSVFVDGLEVFVWRHDEHHMGWRAESFGGSGTMPLHPRLRKLEPYHFPDAREQWDMRQDMFEELQRCVRRAVLEHGEWNIDEALFDYADQELEEMRRA